MAENEQKIEKLETKKEQIKKNWKDSKDTQGLLAKLAPSTRKIEKLKNENERLKGELSLLKKQVKNYRTLQEMVK